MTVHLLLYNRVDDLKSLKNNIEIEITTENLELGTVPIEKRHSHRVDRAI